MNGFRDFAAISKVAVDAEHTFHLKVCQWAMETPNPELPEKQPEDVRA